MTNIDKHILFLRKLSPLISFTSYNTFIGLFAFFICIPQLKANEGFTGDFDPGNWSSTGSTGNGSVNTNNAPESITITGPDASIGSGSTKQKYFIPIPSGRAGTYSFDWIYTTNDEDGAYYDQPNLINGSTTSVFSGFDASIDLFDDQSGSISTFVDNGDNFGFEIDAIDSILGSASIKIISFKFPALLTATAQPYAAMQHVGLEAINNQTALVLDNAAECKNNGWTIDGGKYCVFAAAANTTSDVYGDSTYGGYDTANFTSSYGVESKHNQKWTLGLAYGNGTSNFGAYDFSNTTASIESDNNFYSAYAVKQANEDLRLSWLVGLSDHDYDGSRTYSGNTATSSYKGNGYAAAMDVTWDKNVIGKKGRPYAFQQKLGLAYASHEQDSFSETGSGDLMTISQDDVNTFLLKGGVDVSTQLIVNQGKNIFVPRLGIGYEMDMRSDWDTSDSIKAKLTSSTSDPTAVKAKTIGKNKGFVNVGGDYYLTDRLLVNANASLKVTGEGSESSYGGGFSWFF